MFMLLIQGQEGGGPGHQCGSSAGTASPGHEPQSAHISCPRCGTYPGKNIFILYLNICGGASRHSKHCYIISSNSCGLKTKSQFLSVLYSGLAWRCVKLSSKPTLLVFGRWSLGPAPSWQSWGKKRWWIMSLAVWSCSKPPLATARERHGSAVSQRCQQRTAFPSSRESLGLDSPWNMFLPTRKQTLCHLFPFLFSV